jgi:Asp-tRNA(Asn)/Glu-tRNA(Gln) amidotransferase A subunit family amidase
MQEPRPNRLGAQVTRRPSSGGSAAAVAAGLLELAERGRHISASDLGVAYDSVRDAMSGVADWWDSGLDLLATPVTLEPAWRLGEDAPAKTGMFCAPFSFTGQPALVVPVSMTACRLARWCATCRTPRRRRTTPRRGRTAPDRDRLA